MRCCVATNTYFCNIIQKTERHVKRCISSLQKQGLIKIETSKARKINDKFSRKRKILVTCGKPKDLDEIMSIFWNSSLDQKEKNLLINKILKGEEPVFAQPKLHSEAYMELWLPAEEERRAKDKIKLEKENALWKESLAKAKEAIMNGTEAIYAEKEKERALCDEDEKQFAEKRFNVGMDFRAGQILDNINDGSLGPLAGSTNIEKLLDYTLRWSRNYQLNNGHIERLEPNWETERKERLQALASNTKVVNDKYVIILDLGEGIKAEANLFDYVIWDQNSEEFGIFKQYLQGA